MTSPTAYHRSLLLLCFTALFAFIACDPPKEEPDTPDSKYEYKEVDGDPLDAKIYTLSNGLKVYLSVNKKEPRIQTFVAVRAGSKMDPAETTGLAHYLEHMVFKGTHDIGTTDWEKESVILDQISDKYEEHRQTQDPDRKKAIYAQIDSLSQEASKYSVPNEYDKMISSLGASGTNAYTWVEQTVYTNNIPANELDKWLTVESNRFQTLVLRLFHTELETVYEEFNRSQDSDSRSSWKALMQNLFPDHPYGTQTTIGEGEHLKNPSMVNIHNYFNTYYVPNNMAICLSGDLDPDETIAMIEEHFGSWESQPVPEFTFEEQPAIESPVEVEVFGVQPEHVYVGFRLDGADSKDAIMLKLVDGLLSNGQAGLIDLNLNQKQKVLSASSFELVMKDFGAHMLYGEPREGQTLEEVKELMLGQLDLIKKGEFDDWLLPAVIRNKKLDQIRAYENNRARADKFVDAFIWDMDWEEIVDDFDEMEKVTKEELVAWANENFGDNYVAVYKRNGEATDRHKVDKPKITAIDINRDARSSFMEHFDTLESERLDPMFLDYEAVIREEKLDNGLSFSYVENEFNELFSLYYILDMGKDHDKQLAMAVKYLPYLGTDKYTAEDLQKEFFKLGLSFDVFSSRDKVYVTLSGLEESAEKGIELFEHILANVQPDEQALKDMVDGILKERADAKKDKGSILRGGLVNYGKYGPKSPFTDIMSEQELRSLDPASLVGKIKELTSYKHRLYFYGPMEPAKAMALVDKYHKVNGELKAYPPKAEYPELAMDKNQVYFTHYDMVQTELYLMSKDEQFNAGIVPYAYIFNEYFGAGLSSIVFQEIREAKALAYSAYSYVSTPSKADESHYVYAYIGTQADKLKDAVEAMQALMNDMPEAEAQFNAARDAALKKIESERTVGSAVFWSYESAKDRGLDYDLNKVIYDQLQGMTVADLKAFFNDHVAGNKYTFLVIGNRENVDAEVLESLGDFKELKLEEIFNY